MATNILQKLMKMDASKLSERPTKDYEVKRLSKLMGEPFVLKLQSIPADLYSDIQSDCIDIKKSSVDTIDLYKLQFRTIVEGVQEPNLKDKDLMAHFNVKTPIDLVNKLFIPGEISDISAQITSLCGFESQKDVDEQVKN